MGALLIGMVRLWYDANALLPAGYSVAYNTLDEALAQAAADIQTSREPQPIRVEDESRGILADRQALLDAS